MEVYFDAKCKVCNQCKDFVLRKKKSHISFLDIRESKFENKLSKTIVVVSGGKEYEYGEALKLIFGELKYPYMLFSYLPKFVLTLSYLALREYRNRPSNSICKV
jgi:predicted DCC family thiol-disulfide oxidoreductase YuxK